MLLARAASHSRTITRTPRSSATEIRPRQAPRRRPAAAFQVELRLDAKPVREIHLSRSARADIEDECRRVGDVETGGYLCGDRVFSWHRSQRVPIAGVAATRRAPLRVALDLDHFARADARYAIDGWPVCGDWHSHPGSDNRPSTGDLQGWAKTWQRHYDHNASYLGLIVTLADRPR